MSIRHWFDDAAHGWLMVETKEIVSLNIINKISVFSYLSPDGKFTYLEEDADAAIYIDAIGIQEFDKRLRYNRVYQERQTIRDYPHYQADWLEMNKHSFA